MLDVEGRLYFPGSSNEASDKAEARTMRPPPNESPGTQMKLLLGLHPNVPDIYGFPTGIGSTRVIYRGNYPGWPTCRRFQAKLINSGE